MSTSDRTGRTGGIGGIGRIARICRAGRAGRIGRIGRLGRIGRIGRRPERRRDEAGRGGTRQNSGSENGGRIAVRGRQFRPIPPPFRLDYGVPRGGIEGGIEAESRQIPGRLT